MVFRLFITRKNIFLNLKNRDEYLDDFGFLILDF